MPRLCVPIMVSGQFIQQGLLDFCPFCRKLNRLSTTTYEFIEFLKRTFRTVFVLFLGLWLFSLYLFQWNQEIACKMTQPLFVKRYALATLWLYDIDITPFHQNCVFKLLISSFNMNSLQAKYFTLGVGTRSQIQARLSGMNIYYARTSKLVSDF